MTEGELRPRRRSIRGERPRRMRLRRACRCRRCLINDAHLRGLDDKTRSGTPQHRQARDQAIGIVLLTSRGLGFRAIRLVVGVALREALRDRASSVGPGRVRVSAGGDGRHCHRVNQSDGGNGRSEATNHAVSAVRSVKRGCGNLLLSYNVTETRIFQSAEFP